jgi:hypothetical protein
MSPDKVEGQKIPDKCQHYIVDSVDKLIRWLKKSAVVKVLRQHDGLPEDLINNPDSRNYEFFKKIFDTLRKKFLEMEISDVENTL